MAVLEVQEPTSWRGVRIEDEFTRRSGYNRVNVLLKVNR